MKQGIYIQPGWEYMNMGHICKGMLVAIKQKK